MSDEEKRRADGYPADDDTPDTWPAGPVADEPAADEPAADEPYAADDEPAADEWYAADDEPVADEPDVVDGAADDDLADTAGGSRRPPLYVIVASVLLLVAIGVGIGAVIPSGPPPQPTSAPVPTSNLPTALPLPEAIGDINSTEPIARVDGVDIPRADFVRLYQPGGNPDELLDQLILRELVVQQAQAEGVEVDNAEVSSVIEQIKLANAGGDDERFRTFLAENKLGSEDNLRRLIGRDQLIEQMVLRHTTAEQARARHILLAASSEEEIAARQAEAEELLEQLEGGADFATLAGEKSEDTGSAVQGGDLGWAPRGSFVGPFDEAVFSMDVGERRLVQTEYGWHIIELLEAPEVRPFESMDLLNSQPGQLAFEATFLPWADKLKADAEAANKIEVLAQGQDLVSNPGQ